MKKKLVVLKGEFVLILEKNIKSENLDISMYKEKNYKPKKW